MKRFLPLLLLLLATTAKAQNKDYLLTLTGIGPLKLGMTLPEVEKLLQTTIKLNVIDIDSVALTESIQTKYKGNDVEILLIKRYGDTGPAVVVNGIRSTCSQCKTQSGIGVGSTKLQIIAAFDGYHIDVQPDYSDDDTPQKSKTHSTITVKQDKEGDAILFKMINNKVVAFLIYPIYDDEE